MLLNCVATRPKFLNVQYVVLSNHVACLGGIFQIRNNIFYRFFFCFLPSSLYVALWCRLVLLVSNVLIVVTMYWLQKYPLKCISLLGYVNNDA